MRTLFTLFFVLSIVSAVNGQEDQAIDQITEFEDYYFFDQIEIRDTLVFLTTKYGLSIYTFNEDNLDQPPVEIARYPTLGISGGLFIEDTLCYLDDGYNGLLILNVDNLENIHQLGRCEEAINGSVIKVVDDIAYLACGYYGLRTVDVSDPIDPVMLDWYPLRSEDIRVAGDLVYSISERRDEIALFDVSDPADIQLVEQFEIADNPSGLEVAGNYLYTMARRIFTVVSVQNPREMEIVCESERRYSSSPLMNAIRYQDGYLFLGKSQVWNVNDPHNPVRLGGGYYGAYDLELSEIVSYSSSSRFNIPGRGILVHDIREFEPPQLLHWISNSEGFLDVFIQGNNLYLSSRFRYGPKLVIFDISDMSNIEKIGEIDSTAYFEGYDGIFVQNELAILSTWDVPYELNIFSLEDIEHPEEIGRLERITAKDLVSEGDYIYVAADRGGFKVVSIANPRDPEVVWEHFEDDLSFHVEGITISGDYVHTVNYVSGVGYDFRTWDKSDPEDVQLVGSCAVVGFEGKVAVTNEFAYVVTMLREDNLSIVSIADPEHPEVVTVMDLPHSYYAYDCYIEGNFLYVSLGIYGFAIYSLENPERPELLAWYDIPDYAVHLAVHDSYVFCPNAVYDCARVTGRWNVQISEESHDFGNVQLDTSALWELTISNEAQQPVEIIEVTCDSAAFMVDFDDTITIDPDEETTVEVTFTPAEQRPYTSTITIHTERCDLIVQLSGTGVELSASEDEAQLPLEFALYDAYPNPFNAMTNIRFSLPSDGHTIIAVYDLNGHIIKTLINKSLRAGYHTMIWDGTNSKGTPVSSGLYFYRIEAGGFMNVKKMMLIR
ncbi:MAG: FlgD immunoglobulin-like domain containing protein [Candidatus Hatepunaea meridiana]|nr:FlgD immunoglobulin-like domain containing protein [Candidatus Hatepunaea meridiana]